MPNGQLIYLECSPETASSKLEGFVLDFSGYDIERLSPEQFERLKTLPPHLGAFVSGSLPAKQLERIKSSYARRSFTKPINVINHSESGPLLSELWQSITRVIETNAEERRQTSLDRDSLYLNFQNHIDKVSARLASASIFGGTADARLAVAHYIHHRSPMGTGPFIEVAGDTEGLTRKLRGFGATKGLIELANGGTLFIDDIDKTNEKTQEILLELLMNHQVRRVRSETVNEASVRLLAGAQRYPEEPPYVRSDLWYRLTVLPVKLPFLRRRLSDFASLLTDLKSHDSSDKVSSMNDALVAIHEYGWPNRLRELSQFVESFNIRQLTATQSTHGPVGTASALAFLETYPWARSCQESLSAGSLVDQVLASLPHPSDN